MFRKISNLVAVIAITIFIFGSNTSYASETESAGQEVLDAIESTEFDLSEPATQETSIYNEKGEQVGVIGIEPVTSTFQENSLNLESVTIEELVKEEISEYSAMSVQALASGEIEPNATKDIDFGDSTWKIYYYSVSVNFSYYIDVNVSTSGIATIKKAYDKFKLVTPPYTVDSDVLTIIRATETSTSPAHARYTLTLNTYVGGEWDIYLESKIKDKKLTTRVN
ncbi:hypothetical protein [Peribacillus acanthi]|uniref:hypothetical protein n=1 Tax=Peribacillus acanthi TaxID=2171554 RepID=UPI000D3E4DE6|nr:hypothetical protein [Peribacillus acanthi]